MRAEHTYQEVVAFTGVAPRSVERIAAEAEVSHVDDARERDERGVGRPGKTAAFEAFVRETLDSEQGLRTLEVLRRAKLRGYEGRKSVFYELGRRLRPTDGRVLVRFEGHLWEFCQHDFGEVDVEFLDGARKHVQSFASRLKWSRLVGVTLVGNQQAETLVRTLADHFAAFGGVPLCAVFDRPKTVALKWKRNGEVTKWNPLFA